MKTSDSWPPHRYSDSETTMVQASDPVSVSTMHEIELFNICEDRLKDWFYFMNHSIHQDVYVDERNSIIRLIHRLPPEGDLLIERPTSPITYYYRSEYTKFPSTDRLSRSVIFMNLTEFHGVMGTWNRRFKEAILEEKIPEYERLYGLTLSVFYAWMEVARPRIRRPPFSAFRAREQEGRASQTSRRLMTLLTHMKDL